MLRESRPAALIRCLFSPMFVLHHFCYCFCPSSVNPKCRILSRTTANEKSKTISSSDEFSANMSFSNARRALYQYQTFFLYQFSQIKLHVLSLFISTNHRKHLLDHFLQPPSSAAVREKYSSEKMPTRLFWADEENGNQKEEENNKSAPAAGNPDKKKWRIRERDGVRVAGTERAAKKHEEVLFRIFN